MSEWVSMPEVLPEGEADGCKLDHFEVSEDASRLAMFSDGYVRPGKYARLRVNGCLMMTDTPMERRTNSEFKLCANGDVLVAGLGIGMVLLPVLRKSEVRSVRVIEKYEGVVALVEPWIRNALTEEESAKLTVEHADIFEWKPPKGVKWDTIYFDIWPNICTDNLEEIATLNRRFGRRLRRDNPSAWKGSWQEDLLRYRRRQEKREERWRF